MHVTHGKLDVVPRQLMFLEQREQTSQSARTVSLLGIHNGVEPQASTARDIDSPYLSTNEEVRKADGIVT